MLNKRIQDLQNSRIEFARMIKELNVSIMKAESNVNEMSELSKITSNEIKSVVEEAREISSELVEISKKASDITTKLKNDIQSNNLASSQFDTTSTLKNDSYADMTREKFTEDDLAPIDNDSSNHSEEKYTNHFKKFFHTINNKDNTASSASLSQASYYDTLRKINAKK
jgi:uncharacterized protein